jgi:sec-independent protein translocase protein TatC
MGPAGAFVVATKVAIYAGLIIASPFVFYFIATFVFPALKMMERKYIYRGLFFGGGLFLLGVSFCFFFLMPRIFLRHNFPVHRQEPFPAFNTVYSLVQW